MNDSKESEKMDSSVDEVIFCWRKHSTISISFSFYLLFFFLLHSNVWLSPKEYVSFFIKVRFFCTNQQIWGWGCVAPNFPLNLQRVFLPQSANYSLKCTTNEVLWIAKMHFRLQNSKYICAGFQPGLFIIFFIYIV